jgi:hypothetical protein
MYERSAHFFIFAAVTVLAFSGCSDGTQSALPTGPLRGANLPLAPQITLVSVDPPNGSTIRADSCESEDGEVFCYRNARLTLDVEGFQAVTAPLLLHVVFIGGGLECASTNTSLGPQPLRANSTTRVTTDGLSFSYQAGSFRCPLPQTTTSIVVSLWDGTLPPQGAIVFQRQIELKYTLVFP